MSPKAHKSTLRPWLTSKWSYCYIPHHGHDRDRPRAPPVQKPNASGSSIHAILPILGQTASQRSNVAKVRPIKYLSLDKGMSILPWSLWILLVESRIRFSEKLESIYSKNPPKNFVFYHGKFDNVWRRIRPFCSACGSAYWKWYLCVKHRDVNVQLESAPGELDVGSCVFDATKSAGRTFPLLLTSNIRICSLWSSRHMGAYPDSPLRIIDSKWAFEELTSSWNYHWPSMWQRRIIYHIGCLWSAATNLMLFDYACIMK